MKSRFAVKKTTVEVEGEEYVIRALKVKELEQLVEKYGDDPNPMVLTAHMISASSKDGKLKDVTPDELDEWPMKVFKEIQEAVLEINGLDKEGEEGSGNA